MMTLQQYCNATFAITEIDKTIGKELSNASPTFRKINSVLLKKFLNLQESLIVKFYLVLHIKHIIIQW